MKKLMILISALIATQSFAGTLVCESKTMLASFGQTDVSSPYANYTIDDGKKYGFDVKIEQFCMTKNALAFSLRLSPGGSNEFEVSAIQNEQGEYVGKLFLTGRTEDVKCVQKL